MYIQNKNRIGVLLAALLCSVPTMATPITYTFTTGALCSTPTCPAASANLLPYISAESYVSGSFTYDPDRPLLGIAPRSNPLSDDGAGYQAIDNLQGTLHIGGSGSSYSFSATQGITAVYNEGYSPATPIPSLPSNDLDFLVMVGGRPSAPISGFTLGNLPLDHVTLFWLETLVGNAPDFLPNNSLPSSLPAFSGRLSLDFGANGVATDTVFFNNLTVTPVPLPGAAMLLMSGVFTLFAGARVRRRRDLAT